MNLLPSPQPPDWTIDWQTIDAFPWIRDMKNCPQNPTRHAEGDVWTHVHMVCEAMAILPAWRVLPDRERDLLFNAALLHDVAKPACTRMEPDGSISSRGHSWRGAIRARQILWKRGVGFRLREQIAALVRHHLVPFYLADSEAPDRLVVEVSQTARCDWLSILAESDARGRICPDPDHLLIQIAKFRDEAIRMNCLDRTFSFPTSEERFGFFHVKNRTEATLNALTPQLEVVLMCGLPAAGKDTWIKKHLPQQKQISLDELRFEMRVAPSDPNGEVLSRARQMARQFLERGQSFVWNATNLSRHVRSDCVRFFQEYGAKVRIIYVEVPAEQLFAQNRTRKRKLPENVLERLLDRWEVPDVTEAHDVEWVVD
jgi:predicted kinase